MKLALVMRYITLMLITVLTLGSAGALGAPVTNMEQGAAATMAMGGDHAHPAQHSGCSGCIDSGTTNTGMAKGAIAVDCSIACLAFAMLPSATFFTERATAEEWRLALRTEHSGVVVGIDPYPPNFLS